MAFQTYRTGSGLRIQEVLAQYGEKAAKSLGKNLYREGLGIIEQSKGLVPVDTGALRSSAYTAPPIRDGDHITVELGYGGPAGYGVPKDIGLAALAIGGFFRRGPAEYAIYVHENLEAHHPVGMAKFLQIPFDMATRGMSGRIADGMSADLGTNAGIGDYSTADLGAEDVLF